MQITLKNIILKYHGDEALNIPFLEFEGNLGVAGWGGAGKTNLLKVIAGLEYIENGGEILFDGQNIASKPIKKRGIALISKDTPLFENKTALQNLIYPLVKHGQSKKTALEKALQTGFDALNKKVRDLSNEQRTDLLLYRVLIRDPKLILIDEPCGFALSAEYFWIRAKELLKDKQLICASYDSDALKPLCDSLIFLKKGTLDESKS